MHQRRRRSRRSASGGSPPTSDSVTLAVALLVAAAGAIGYGIAGDGLHPERWLGAAAVVCGAGMIIGAWRGRAVWPVLPGLLFAASGFVAGQPPSPVSTISRSVAATFWTDSPTDGLPAREDLVAGQITVTIDDAPPPNTRSDLRVGVGVIEVVVDDDVALEVRAHVHDGHIVVNGDETPNDGDPVVLHFGPDRTPEVIISATVSTGELRINRHEVATRSVRPAVPAITPVPAALPVPAAAPDTAATDKD